MSNSALLKLYIDYFSERKLSPETGEKCCKPLLIKMPQPELWQASAKRILIIGQETLGKWGGKKTYNSLFDSSNLAKAIEELADEYTGFNFSASNKRHRNSPFWRAFRKFGEPSKGEILWSNVFKFDYNGGSVIVGTGKKEDRHILQEILKAQKGLLRKEIEILSPSCIVFFTGPNYDEAIRYEFPNPVHEEVEGFEKSQFARLRHKDFGDSAVFRLYHPGYLNRNKGYTKLYLEKLSELLRGSSANEEKRLKGPA